MRLFLLALSALSLSVPAHAEWHRASSEHFLIYADQRPETIRKFAERLEKFDGAVRAIRGMDDLPLSQGNRLTVFVLKDVGEVQRLAHDKSGMIAGFYEGRVNGSVAFVPPLASAARNRMASVGSRVVDTTLAPTDMGTDVVLLHEYSHHLMMQDLDSPYPRWLVEGFAEFMATAKFETDGSVGIGLPAGHRYLGLDYGGGLPLESLLSASYEKRTTLSGEEFESIYGKGWLLTHYLTFEPSRRGQLKAYVAAIAKGASDLDAARQAFGDLGKLDRDLLAYLHRSSLPYLKVSGAALNFAPIQIAPLSDGGAAVIPLLAELESQVPDNQLEGLATRIRSLEVKFPGDALVETTLAQAEVRAGHGEAAEAASDRALKADPRSTEAMVLKGRAIALRASKARGPAAHSLFEQARTTFIAANKIDAEDPDPLYRFYRAFADEGIAPSPNALSALHYAAVLAPQDLNLRVDSAMAYLDEGKGKEARRELIPVAHYPHGGGMSEMAQKMIERIDAGDTKGAIAAAEAKSAD